MHNKQKRESPYMGSKAKHGNYQSKTYEVGIVNLLSIVFVSHLGTMGWKNAARSNSAKAVLRSAPGRSVKGLRKKSRQARKSPSSEI
uniref:Uncharacterized protein n=1 Tax=Romanomermis culicivorax TaxID=13658 RepID=A0A915KJF4_ROMCU